MDAKQGKIYQNTAQNLNFKMENVQSLPVIIAIVIVILTILFLTFFVLRKKVKRQGVLLLGLSDAGKTLIFSRLAYAKFVETVTSMKENVSEYKTSNASLQLVDIPGQERVRGRIFDRFKSSARAIVFVIDSGSVQKELRDVAEYLHSVLSDDVTISNQPPVLILCNKQDETLGKSAASIKVLLEKELNLVRDTKASQQRLSNEDRAPEKVLGDPSKTFEFSDLPYKLSFAECSALTTNEDDLPNLEDLENWIDNLN